MRDTEEPAQMLHDDTHMTCRLVISYMVNTRNTTAEQNEHEQVLVDGWKVAQEVLKTRDIFSRRGL